MLAEGIQELSRKDRVAGADAAGCPGQSASKATGRCLLGVCGDKHFAQCYLKGSNFPLTCANLPAAGLHHLDFHQKMFKCLIKFPLFQQTSKNHTELSSDSYIYETSICWNPVNMIEAQN